MEFFGLAGTVLPAELILLEFLAISSIGANGRLLNLEAGLALSTIVDCSLLGTSWMLCSGNEASKDYSFSNNFFCRVVLSLV